MHGTTPTLTREDGHIIAYHQQKGKEDGRPGILFCGGFRSDMQGTKALALEGWCRTQGLAYTRFDYLGHGQSSGQFEQGSIGRWAEDAGEVLQKLTQGPQIVVGSSMGGWVMLLLALRHPARIAGLVGIAAAPDFTQALIYEKLPAEQQELLDKGGEIALPACGDEAPYRITAQLIIESRKHLLLNKPTLPIHCPVHLLHGMQDDDVPWETSLTVAQKLKTGNVVLELVKNAGHRMSDASELARIERAILQLSG